MVIAFDFRSKVPGAITGPAIALCSCIFVFLWGKIFYPHSAFLNPGLTNERWKIVTKIWLNVKGLTLALKLILMDNYISKLTKKKYAICKDSKTQSDKVVE